MVPIEDMVLTEEATALVTGEAMALAIEEDMVAAIEVDTAQWIEVDILDLTEVDTVQWIEEVMEHRHLWPQVCLLLLVEEDHLELCVMKS